MKHVSLFLVLVFPFMLFGQATEPLAEDHTFSAGFQNSYDVYNYEFTSFDYSNSINYTVGAAIKYRFKTRFEVKAGLAYSQKGFTYEVIQNPGNPDFLDIVEFRFDVGYIDFSAILGYRYQLNKRIVFVPGAGLVYGKHVVTAVYLEDEYDELFSELYADQFAKSIYGINIQLGVEYHFFKKWFFLAEPYFREGLNNIYEEAVVTSPSSYGIGFGLYRKF